MELLKQAIDYILHVENHLRDFIGNYGTLVYLLLFVILFCETGLVVTPFLPGDSLLFAVGALSAPGLVDGKMVPALIDWKLALPLLLVAVFLGDNTNYFIGKWLGPKAFRYKTNFFFRQEHLQKAHNFYEKYGARAIILARFVPIVRTFAPFVAGLGTMKYRHFLLYSIGGSVLWVGLFIGAGHFFGGLPIVQKNMKLVILAIIVVSLLPIAVEVVKGWLEKRKAQ